MQINCNICYFQICFIRAFIETANMILLGPPPTIETRFGLQFLKRNFDISGSLWSELPFKSCKADLRPTCSHSSNASLWSSVQDVRQGHSHTIAGHNRRYFRDPAPVCRLRSAGYLWMRPVLRGPGAWFTIYSVLW